MPKKVDIKARLLKNRRKFVEALDASLDGRDVPVLKPSEVKAILGLHRKALELTQRLTVQQFIEHLAQAGLLKEFKFKFPHANFTRYAHPDVSLYSVIATFYKPAYFSHYSALYLHQLTEQLPKTIYLNLEQTPKPSPNGRKGLEQANIDRAFRKKQRLSNNFCVFEDQTIYILNGKFTHNEGVEKVALSDQEQVKVTGLERTLIDAAVRPTYSGGVQQVLQAFERARELGISINRLSATLKKLNYVYPYHQVIGFYLEKAGYSETQIGLMERLDKDYDFYLDYDLRNPDYSERWRLYVPKGF